MPKLAYELQVILHGIAQVHKVVQVHRVSLSATEADPELLRFPWGLGTGWQGCQQGAYRSPPIPLTQPCHSSLTRPQRDPHPLWRQLGGPFSTGTLAERLILKHLLPASGLLQLPHRAAPSQQLLSPGAAPCLCLPRRCEVLQPQGKVHLDPSTLQTPSPAPSLQFQPLLTSPFSVSSLSPSDFLPCSFFHSYP